MAALVHQEREPVLQLSRHGVRPSLRRLFTDQLRYALQDLWRTRIAFVFTFLFPLTFLVVLGALVGNDTVDAGSPVRMMQFLTPSAAVMGALYGAFPTVATSLADARERGILKRVRGTPLPSWLYLAARVVAAALFALASLTLMLAVGVVAYDVQVVWRTLAATTVTALASVLCFAAAGVAVAALARTAAMAQAVSIAVAVVLSFVSGVTAYGVMPAWADRTGSLFPVKAFHDALRDQLDPFATGRGWDLGALALVVGWGVGALALAALVLRRESEDTVLLRRTPERWRHRGPEAAATSPATHRPSVHGTDHGRPGWLRLLRDQARWATVAALRDPGWVFFAIAMPVGLFAFNASVLGGSGSGTPSAATLPAATGMIAWGVVVTVLVNVPEALARARERGVLKRLRGTPVPIEAYAAGRYVSALLLVLTTAVLVLLVGVLFFDLRVAAAGLPVAAGILLLGSASLGACGLLLAALAPTSKAVAAVALGITLPLAFLSDVFVIEGMPAWTEQVGAIFPLRHLTTAMSSALDPTGPTVGWPGVMVMGAWLVCAGLVARRTFRWSPPA